MGNIKAFNTRVVKTIHHLGLRATLFAEQASLCVSGLQSAWRSRLGVEGGDGERVADKVHTEAVTKSIFASQMLYFTTETVVVFQVSFNHDVSTQYVREFPTQRFLMLIFLHVIQQRVAC